MKNLIKLGFALLLTLGIYSNSFGQWWAEPVPAGKIPIHRIVNISTGRHLLCSTLEAKNLTTSSGTAWIYESKLGYLRDNSALGIPVYRFYRHASKAHFFSTNSTPPSGYVSEGIIGYTSTDPIPANPCDADSMVCSKVAVFRYARLTGWSGHVYTNRYSELGAGNSTWLYEGPVFWLDAF